MISANRFVSLVAALSLRWQESCGDPSIFCYRVVCGLVMPRRKSEIDSDSPLPCSIPSDNSCTLSTTSRA